MSIKLDTCPRCGNDEACEYLGKPGPGAIRCWANGCDFEISGFDTDEEAAVVWNAITIKRPIADDAFTGCVDGDTPLQAAAREAGWALMELVDGIDWEKRQHVSNIITRLGAALWSTGDT